MLPGSAGDRDRRAASPAGRRARVVRRGLWAKYMKPDLEAACQVMVDGAPAALMMGSGSSPARMRWSLLRLENGDPRPLWRT